MVNGTIMETETKLTFISCPQQFLYRNEEIK